MKKPNLRKLEEKNKAGMEFLNWPSQQSADRRPHLVSPVPNQHAHIKALHSGTQEQLLDPGLGRLASSMSVQRNFGG